MGRKKIDAKYIESNLTKQTFSNRQARIFEEVDALAKQCNVKVAVLTNSSFGQPYICGSPCFNSVVGRSQNPYPRRERSSSLKHAKILKNQAKLDSLMEELEREKEREKVLKKRLEDTFENYDIKEIKNSDLQGLAVFKEKLETLQNTLKSKRSVMEGSSSLKE